jgi:hypothetical protein
VVPSWRDIWADPAYRKNLKAASVLYMESTFCFYLLTFYLKYFPGSIFENAAIFAMSDLVAFIIAGIVLKCTTIGVGIRISSCVAGTGGLLYLFMSNLTNFAPLVICLARVGMTMLFNICLISVNRLFPTQNVTTAYGIVNFLAHIFACLAPMIAEIPNPYPFIVFVILVCIGFLSSFFLTESSVIEARRAVSADKLGEEFRIDYESIEAEGNLDDSRS